MFGERCPNFILRANLDAALSLARGYLRFLAIGLILILLGIFWNMFGEKCPNFILRAKRDAALSLARGVF